MCWFAWCLVWFGLMVCAEKKVEIDGLASEYMENVRNLSPEERVQHLKRIELAYSKCKEFSDDKVQLAMQIYELVCVCVWWGVD